MSMEWETSLPLKPFDEAKVWLVMGSAGSGKSHQLERVIDGLIGDGVKLDSICYILFNKQPGEEFKDRYKAKGYTEKDMPYICTHHALMRRLLKIPTKNILEGERLIEWGAKHGFPFSDAILDSHHESACNGFDQVFMSLSKKLYLDDTKLNLLEEKLFGLLRMSEASDNQYTHVRYLHHGCKLGMFPSGVEYVFVDEAQDNGKVQMDWLKGVMARVDIKGVMLAGDDKQAINEFKGSNPDLFLDFPADRRVALRTTWRCPPEVLRAANQVIFPVRRRSPLSDKSERTIKGKVLYMQSFMACVPLLRQKIEAGENVLGLVRNNYVKRQIFHLASTYGLPVRQERYDTVRSVLAALKKIRTTGRIHGDTLMQILPHKRKRLGELKADAYWTPEALALLRTGDYADETTRATYYQMQYAPDGMGLIDAEWLGFSPQFIRDVEAWSFRIDKWNLSASDLGEFKNLLRSEGKGWGKIDLMTIHGAKGLEADNVVLFVDIAGATAKEEMMFPDRERRVWYVGMTRARTELYVTKARSENRSTNLIYL